MVPPPSPITVGVCNQFTLLILNYIRSRLVTLIQVSDVFGLTVSFKLIYFNFQIFLLLVPEMSTSFASYISVRLCILLWFGCCNHCILAYFLCCKKPKHSSSNHGLCCFSSYRCRLSAPEVLIFSLLLSQAPCMSLSLFKFSKAADMFKILIWYCFLTSSSFSFLILMYDYVFQISTCWTDTDVFWCGLLYVSLCH